MVHTNDIHYGPNRTMYLFILSNLTDLDIWYAMNIDFVHMSIYGK